jgi:hypothetical protein
MKLSRPLIAAVLTIVALLATSAPAHASVTRPFAATSGDNCRYGATQGYLTWRYSATTPVRPVAVDVRGMVIDHPLPNENFLCRDDAFYSVAIFTVFSASVVRKEISANNELLNFAFTHEATSTAGLSRLMVQVCRFPLPITQPPATGYCGVPQHYAPVVFDPPPPAGQR